MSRVTKAGTLTYDYEAGTFTLDGFEVDGRPVIDAPTEEAVAARIRMCVHWVGDRIYLQLSTAQGEA